MKIMINGEAKEVTGPTLADVLTEVGFGDAKVATAVNEMFVAAGARSGHTLEAGDRVEIVAPRQGG